MESSVQKLKDLLRTLFQFDCADLDFGIYRIMNYKREVIERFIEKDLIEAVTAELNSGILAQQSRVAAELQQVARQIRESLGEDALDGDGRLAEAFHNTPLGRQYLDLQARAAGAKDLASLENSIFNHLYTFFSRYYDNGDFISKRRYSKQEKYAIPYNGEEVYLYWANSDQYYVKTAEYFRDYRFQAPNGVAVHFKLKEAQLEKDNNKGDKRFFFPRPGEASFDPQARESVIPFEFRALTEQEKVKYGTRNHVQDAIIAEALKEIPGQFEKNYEALAALTAERHRTADGKSVSYLEHHLRQYTRRNTSDFFIHKDLKGFLTRELDFYLKNEVLNLDELEAAGETWAEGWFQVMRVIRAIGMRIITFLAQIEDFQKKLFEKKKFVTETQYFITVGNIKEEFYKEIAANDAQWAEWKELFHIDEEEQNIFTVPLKTREEKRVAFLKAHPTLVLDTKYFDGDFGDRLLASFEDLDEQTDGLLIHGENFQALNLLLEKYAQKVKLIYLDPPYNTGSDEFLYKDNYQSSCWLSMMADRLALASRLLRSDGVLVVQISDNEDHHLKLLLDKLFPGQFINRISIRTRSPSGFKTVNKGVFESAEYLYIYARDKSSVCINPVFEPCEYDPNYRFEIVNPQDPPQAWQIRAITDTVAHLLGYADPKKARKDLGSKFDQAVAEYALENAEKVFRYTEIDDLGASRETVALKHQSQREPDKIFVHEREGYETRYIKNGHELTFYSKKVREINGQKVPTMPLTNIWTDISWEGIAAEGCVQLKKGKKPERLLERLISMFTNPGDLVLDFFGGTGTTGAVAQKMGRKWILVDFQEDMVQKSRERLAHVFWGDGGGIAYTQQDQKGIIKFIKLESYEEALDNISFSSPIGQRVLEFDDYLLKYMLDWETKESETFLNVEKLARPFSYELILTEGQETKKKRVDIPETFNFLLGLHVLRREVYQDGDRRYVVCRGTLENKRVVVIWRETESWGQEDYERDKKFVAEQKLTEGADEVFVNGDSFIPGARSLDPVFKSRMFGGV